MPVTGVQRTSRYVPEAQPEPARPRPPSPQSGAESALAAAVPRPGSRIPSEAALSSRLNAFMKASAGPYAVRGGEVVVTPQFRMEGGIGKKNLPGIEKAVGPAAWRQIANDAAWATTGKGSPEAIRKTTQALIDSPEFRKYSHLDPETAVRKLQWDFGIGVDCSGYVHQAFLFARGSGNGSAASERFGLGKVEQSGLQNLPGPLFRRVEPGQVRAGDVLVLVNGDDGTGHKVIVHGRNTAPPGTELHARAVERLGGGRDTKIHIITVDSSWGAGHGDDPHRGGVKRAEWVYDETTKKWGTLHRLPNGGLLVHPSSKAGPYDHDLQGAFRPRAES